MARPIRGAFEGALYHVTARGNERRAIFRSDADRLLFLLTLAGCIRVRLGGERKVDVAPSLGYRDGSGVLQAIKRLDAKAARDKKLREQLEGLQDHFLSSVQS